MTDRAPQVAAFLVERQANDIEPETLWAEMLVRWPSLTPEEGDRGARIAAEILAATIAENAAALDVAEVTLAEDLDRAGGAEGAELRARMATTVENLIEDELRGAAEGLGISPETVREFMQAIQSGEAPLLDDEETDHAGRDR